MNDEENSKIMDNLPTIKSKHLVFSAPSGGGKTTIIKKLMPMFPQLALSISATTRPKRPGEVDGVDYFFMTVDQFNEAMRRNRFLEHEQVHGNFYGTLREKVDEMTASGKSVVFDIDVMGAQSIKKAYPDSVLFFIKPPSEEVLVKRLRDRMSEDDRTIRKRLERIRFEYDQAYHFDHVILNDDLDKAVEDVKNLILS